MKQILVVEMGGTISAKGVHRFDYKDYTSGIFEGEDFLKQIPELGEMAQITFSTFSKISSTKVKPENWIFLRQFLLDKLSTNYYDGIVISHGTSTLEETAYFLHLTMPVKVPIVFVGAQRPFTSVSTDAPLNLINAIRVASSKGARGKGVLVVLNNEINSAREATKGDTYRLNSFHSYYHGYLGLVDTDETVQFYRKPTRLHTFNSSFSELSIKTLPKVEIVYSYAGADNFLIDSIIESGNYAGIVVAGIGAGLFTPEQIDSLQKAIDKGLFVGRSSRGGSGRVVDIKPYKSYSFINTDDLSPQKARILLMLSLLKYNCVEKIQHVFNTH